MVKRLVILGDVVKSRDITDRDAFSEQIRTACRRANQAADNRVVAPFEVLIGVDEIGGVLSDMTKIYQVIDALRRGVYPERLRLAASYDTVDVSGSTVSEFDGPAFHKADDVLNRIERDRLNFDFSSDATDEIRVISSEIHLIQVLKHRWTDHQREVIAEYERSGSQSEVANTFGMSQPAVSQVLNRARYRDIAHAEQRITEYFGDN